MHIESPIESSAVHAIENSLFNHVVCRVGGLPVERVEELRVVDSFAAMYRLFEIEEELSQVKESLSERLHDAVKTATDDAERNRIISLRRDVYNLRSLSDTHLNSVSLSDDVQREIGNYRKMLSNLQLQEEEFAELFGQEVIRIREVFKSYLSDDAFQKGLLISSASLFKSQAKYVAPFKVNLKGKVDKIERGLLRYFTRMAMKATPFGTFCSVIPGEIKPGKGYPEFAFTGDLGKKKSKLRLNKSLYVILEAHLRKRPEVSRHFYLELNPTLHKADQKYVYLSVIEGLETFQRLGLHPIVVLLESILALQKLTYAQVVDEIHAQPQVDNSEEEISQFIDKLIEIGLLSFRTGIHEQETEWNMPLCKLLEKINDEHAQNTIQLLNDLYGLLLQYDEAGIQERATLLGRMNAAIDEAFELMGIAARIPTNLPFFEDGTAEAGAIVSENAIKPIEYHLGTLISKTLSLAWPRSEMFAMRHFFDTYYGADIEAVPLLQFYEDYYREHFKTHLDVEGKTKSDLGEEEVEYDVKNPFQLEIVEGILNARSRLGKLILSKWEAATKQRYINFTEAELHEIVQGAPPAHGYTSSAVFGQFVPGTIERQDSGQFILANSAYTAGYGKYFSRFLYLFPANEFEERIRSDNRSVEGVLVAEICGESGFNANLHPPLMDWEINYPTGESAVSDLQLDSHTLHVRRDAKDSNSLVLWREQDGVQVYPIDLGFLNTKMRPPLYQLLIRFAPPSNYRIPVPGWLIHPENEPEELDGSKISIQYRPRIVYEDTIVLARASWRIPGALFPHKLQNETLEAYFLRVNRWRVEHTLPEEGFIRVLVGRPPRKEQAAQKTEKEKEEPTFEKKAPVDLRVFTRASRDFTKPQYIDFRNPLLVNLFGKVAGNLSSFVVNLEERYPTKEGLPESDEGHFANEFVVQFNFKEPSKTTTSRSCNTTGRVHAS